MKRCTKCSSTGPFQSGQAVCKACRAKADKLRRESSARAAKLAEAGSANQLHPRIYVGELGDVTAVRDLKKHDFRSWRDDYEEVEIDFDDVIELPTAKKPQIEVVEVEKLTAVQEHRLKVKNADLLRQVKLLTSQLSDAHFVGDIVAESQTIKVDGITPRETLSGLREGTAFVMASDWHVEEEVKPEQVAGRNRYNLEISAHRMTRFFESILWAINSQRNTFQIKDLVLWFGGDFITNFLHEDNVLTNLLSPPEALAYIQAALSDGIKFLLTDPELERIVIPCNDGNHGRSSKRMGSSSRTKMSLEIMLYRMLKREFAHEPRVEFIIAEGELLHYDIYGRTVRFVHGDSISYSNGVGGVMIPIMKALAAWETIRHADLTAMGHWHQRLVLPNLMVNSSLIGYSPFSLTIKAKFEPPSQNFSILEPKRFRSVDLPLYVSERSDDDGY
ncbi:MAG TPA: hypothetical protein VIY48_14525 [Candidatus Paceibacterota bacterium]